MEISGDYTFDVPQELVWKALLDPDVLASVMPGGEGFEQVGENEYAGTLKVKVGPVQGNFAGNIKLSDIVAPESYSMAVEGKGAPGFVNASGRMQLAGQGDSTTMTYEGSAQIGGRIASVGQRLLDASTKSIIRQSLEGLNAYLVAQYAASKVADEAETVDEEGAAAPVPVPVPEYVPPSQASLAVNVAKDVAGELIPAKYRLAILIPAAIVVIIILVLLLT